MPKPSQSRKKRRRRRQKPIMDVAKVLEKLHDPDTVFEVRILECHNERGRPFTAAGYFDCPERAADAIAGYEEEYEPKGIYWTLNPVNPALLARSPNQLTDYPKALTSDKDIVGRRYIPLDFDPVRPSDISATDEEKQSARERCEQVRLVLADRGWPDPLVGDTGNGYRLLYRIELPNDEEATSVTCDPQGYAASWAG